MPALSRWQGDRIIRQAYAAANKLHTFVSFPGGPVILAQIWRFAERLGLTALATCAEISSCFEFVQTRGKLAALCPIGIHEFAHGFCRVANLLPGPSREYPNKLRRLCLDTAPRFGTCSQPDPYSAATFELFRVQYTEAVNLLLTTIAAPDGTVGETQCTSLLRRAGSLRPGPARPRT